MDLKKSLGSLGSLVSDLNPFKKADPIIITTLMEDEQLGHVKYHLRIDASGGGTLTINGDKVMFLNMTAGDIIRMHLQGASKAEILDFLVHKYDAPVEEINNDFETMMAAIDTVVHQKDTCPISFHGITPEAAFRTRNAPARVDLALTYRCNNDCGHCYVAREKTFPEMDTDGWRRVIDVLKEVGVPHVTLTGGEATLRKDLVDIIQHAEDNNIVCGLVTNGINLADAAYLDTLIAAGLDYIQVTLESHDAAIHDAMVGAKTWEKTVQGLKNAIATDVYTLTNTTLCALNTPSVEQTIDFLASIGLEGTFAMNGIIYSGKGKSVTNGIPEAELEPLLDRVVAKAAEHGFKFIWYSPTRYCEFNPVIHGLGPKRCSAADISMAVEPNGDVLPCQSYFEPIGNVLKDPFKKIWNHKLAKAIRTRSTLPDECKRCDVVDSCGGGCPLHVKQHGAVCMDGRGGM